MFRNGTAAFAVVEPHSSDNLYFHETASIPINVVGP